MRHRTDKFIDVHESAYLELLIADRDAESRKIGLQRLCKLYRQGFRHRDPERLAIFLMGLLHDEAPKVKRWALNALALIGTRFNIVAIVEAIQRNRNDPDIIGASVSALCALLPADEARAQLEKADLPIEGTVLLASIQHSAHFQNELRVTRVNIDTASPAEFRMAGVLVGLNRAPQNLFSLTLPNEDIIGELNHYPEPIVAQYSIWAIYENPTLGLKNLRLHLHDVESKPPNVRRHVYQLVARDAQTAQDNYDFLVMGSEDPSTEARAGLATGLREIYFDSLETLILDWYSDEDADAVRQRMLEHMAVNADRCSSYKGPVLRAYEAAGPSSTARARLESAARDTSLHLDMKKIVYDAEGRDLFSLPPPRDSGAQMSPTQRADLAKVLIVTALAKEQAAVLATLDQYETVGRKNDNNVYQLGTYRSGGDSRSIILASAGMGKANAASVTANALRSFPGIEHIIMVGIAGGCPNVATPDEHVRLGDIVHSSYAGVIEYDYVKETTEGRSVRSSPQRPSAALLQVASVLASRELMSQRPWEEVISAALVKLGDKYAKPPAATDKVYVRDIVVKHPTDASRRPRSPKVHAGTIGTADTLLKNDVTRDELRDRFGVRAVEMEASGLQNAAWAQGRDAFVVRGICDYCDNHKNDTWQNYAALVAAAYARALVEAMPSEWFAQT